MSAPSRAGLLASFFGLGLLLWALHLLRSSSAALELVQSELVALRAETLKSSSAASELVRSELAAQRAETLKSSSAASELVRSELAALRAEISKLKRLSCEPATLHAETSKASSCEPPPPGPRSVVPEATRRVEVNGRALTYDDIVFGYDLIFEQNRLFSQMSWLGVGFQQDGNDAIIIQELIWSVKPDLFVDIGTNQGGSAIFARSIMRLYNADSKVITIDPEPNHHLQTNWDKNSKDRHYKSVIEHPLWKEVTFIKGMSHDPAIVEQVQRFADKAKVVMVNVDGDHSADAVFKDLCAYGRMITLGSYIISQDTKMDRLTNGDAALSGTRKYLSNLNRCGGGKFEVDHDAERLYYSQHLGGYLKRTE